MGNNSSNIPEKTKDSCGFKSNSSPIIHAYSSPDVRMSSSSDANLFPSNINYSTNYSSSSKLCDTYDFNKS